MSRNVKFKITATQLEVASQLAAVMGVNVDTLAQMAMLALLKDSLRTAEPEEVSAALEHVMNRHAPSMEVLHQSELKEGGDAAD